MIVDSLQKVGAARSIVIDEEDVILAGNGVIEAAAEAGIENLRIIEASGNEIIAVRRRGLTQEQKTLLKYYDNRTGELADWDAAQIVADLEADVDLSGLWSDEEIAELVAGVLTDGEQQEPESRPTLTDRFIVPPFSVLDARQGYWQERKRAWLALGIQSELGRGNENLGMSHPETTSTMNFYSEKRRLEAEQDRELSKDETASILAGRGQLKDARAANRQRKDIARSFGQDLMRGENPNFGRRATGTENMASGTSIFDPVLCELAYRWFCPPNGKVLDPFAGGSVRGIVATTLRCEYVGVELRPEQVEANQLQAQAIGASPNWVVGDSAHVRDLVPGDYDFWFTCPPYYDLEVYSDLSGELSALPTYADFLAQYRHIIAESVVMLKPNRFACIVVGDIRDKHGHYRNFVSDTIAAFRDAGCELYNEAILVTALGSLPIRVAKQFEAGRKLGKTHQNVLVFVKGDWRKATKACGQIDVSFADMGLEPRLEHIRLDNG